MKKISLFKDFELGKKIKFIKLMMGICLLIVAIIIPFILPLRIVTIFPVPEEVPENSKMFLPTNYIILFSIICFIILGIFFVLLVFFIKLTNKKNELNEEMV